jgi:hypothetical protein
MRRLVLAAMIVLWPSLCHAQGLGVQVSTLGLGLEGQSAPVGALALRGAGNAMNLSVERNIDGIAYDAELDLRSAGALVDWYPGLGGFRLSGGVRVNGNSVDLTAQPSQTVNLGGATYTPSQVGRLSGSADFNRFAPYLGVGWQGAVMGGRMLVGLDFGALYQGKPDVRLTSSVATPGLADDLVREARAIEDELGGLRFFPVVSLTFTYRF